MRTEGWAVYADGSLAYMGFVSSMDFSGGTITFRWRSVRMTADGVIIGVGIKNGEWMAATYLEEPLTYKPGAYAELTIRVLVQSGARADVPGWLREPVTLIPGKAW